MLINILYMFLKKFMEIFYDNVLMMYLEPYTITFIKHFPKRFLYYFPNIFIKCFQYIAVLHGKLVTMHATCLTKWRHKNYESGHVECCL